MITSKQSPLNTIEIWQPRYKDRKVLIACYKAREHNKIVFTKAKHLAGQEFYISGKSLRGYIVEDNGKIPCYAVPLDDLEPLEYKEDIISTANTLF